MRTINMKYGLNQNELFPLYQSVTYRINSEFYPSGSLICWQGKYEKIIKCIELFITVAKKEFVVNAEYLSKYSTDADAFISIEKEIREYLLKTIKEVI